MTKELEFTTIYPGINVYKNTFNDVAMFLEQAKQESGWEQWYIFGEMLSLQEKSIDFESFPTKEQYMAAREYSSHSQKSLTQEIGEIFYDVTNHWLQMNPSMALMNYHKASASINTYKSELDPSEEYSMNYHTDFQHEKANSPGIKFGITTTFYLNDDYEHGELCFRIGSDYVYHKPQAGDVVVFPSVSPYHHAVKRFKGDSRHIVRSFWEYRFPGTPEWLENQALYGEELWAQMEKVRETEAVKKHSHT